MKVSFKRIQLRLCGIEEGEGIEKVNLFVLITLLTTVSCVSQEKYDELLTRVKVLENQNIYKSEIVFNFVLLLCE